jgi:hypothetical protein
MAIFIENEPVKTVLLPLFVLCALLTKAQDEYHPLIRPNLEWDIVEYSNFDFLFPSSIKKYFYGEDTLIGGQLYTKILYHPYISENQSPIYFEWLVDAQVTVESNFYIREDIEERRVYLYDSDVELEGLIYDFSLEVGDTLFYNHPIGIEYESVVLNIEMVSLNNGELRKMFQLDIGEEFLEGVGSVYYGIQYPMIANISGGGYVFNCMQENGEVIWGNGFNGQCGQYLGTGNRGQTNEVKIFPNPSTAIINVRTSEQFYSYRIIDYQGIELAAGTSNSPLQQLDVSALPRGIYFLELSSKQGGVSVQKFSK